MHSRNILLRLSGKPAKWNQKSAGNLSRRRNSPIPMSQAFESSSLLKNTAAKVKFWRGLVAGHATVARFVDEYAHVRDPLNSRRGRFPDPPPSPQRVQEIAFAKTNRVAGLAPYLHFAGRPTRPQSRPVKNATRPCSKPQNGGGMFWGQITSPLICRPMLSRDRCEGQNGADLRSTPDLTPNRLPSAKRWQCLML